MKLHRLLIGLGLALGAVLATAQPASYPAKPIKLIATYGPGSSIDIIARLVAKPLSEQLGQPVIVENRPGAGGDLGTNIVAKAEKDGYTIGFASAGPITVNPNARKKMPYDSTTDLVPVALIATGPNVILANPSVPVKNLQELIAYTKANPDKATFVEAVWTEVQPADVTLAVRRLVNAGTDVIVIQTNTAQAVATKRALQALGKNVPIMLSLHNSLVGSSKALGDPNGFAGDFEVGAIADASESDSTAREFYSMLQEKHGLKSTWNAMTIMGLGQTIVAVRAIEATIKAKGAGKVTGESVRETLMNSQFTSNDLMGILPGADFSNDNPFPTGTAKVNIVTMKDGKVVRAAGDVAVPMVPKW